MISAIGQYIGQTRSVLQLRFYIRKYFDGLTRPLYYKVDRDRRFRSNQKRRMVPRHQTPAHGLPQGVLGNHQR